MKVASVTVGRPSICLNDVALGYGAHLSHEYLTLAEAVALQKLLNEGIDKYLKIYGDDAHWYGRMTRVAQQTEGKYLGCRLLIRERDVTVFAPARGRVIGVAYSLSGARRLVRGYRGSKR